MKRIVLYCIMTIISWGNIQAQENEQIDYAKEDVQWNIWNISIGDTAHVYADVAYIRDFPGVEGKLLDSLINGQAIYIDEIGFNRMTIRGFSATWCRIHYLKNNQKTNGYIWMGLLALHTQKTKNAETILHGILRKTPETDQSGSAYVFETKLLDANNHLIAKSNHQEYDSGQSYIEAKLLDGMGLDNVVYIYRTGLVGEACGIPSVYHYTAWDGSTFYELPEKRMVGDAGIYYYGEEMLFPSEHGLASNLIIKNMEETEALDPDAEISKYKEKKWQERFEWNGKNFHKISKSPVSEKIVQ